MTEPIKLTREDIDLLLKGIEGLIKEIFIPEITIKSQEYINKVLRGYVIINGSNYERFKLNKENRLCCFLMTEYKNKGKTLEDLYNFLGNGFNHCPFCGAKL